MPDLPIVAALLVTNRSEMFANAYRQYSRQDYGRLLLAIDDSPNLTHGAKMNRLFLDCTHDFAVVFDDDDLYASDRVSKLIRPMLDNPKIECVGTSLVYYTDEAAGKAWLYDNQKLCENWKANANLFWLAAPAYRIAAYDKYGPWENLKAGADLKFLHKIPRENVLDLRDPTLMVCRIHSANAAPKQPHPPAWTEVPMSEVPKL